MPEEDEHLLNVPAVLWVDFPALVAQVPEIVPDEVVAVDKAAQAELPLHDSAQAVQVVRLVRVVVVLANVLLYLGV